MDVDGKGFSDRIEIKNRQALLGGFLLSYFSYSEAVFITNYFHNKKDGNRNYKAAYGCQRIRFVEFISDFSHHRFHVELFYTKFD